MQLIKKNRKLLVALLVVLLGAGLARFLFANREPVYQGRTFSSWFNQAGAAAMPRLDNPDPAMDKINAATAIHAMGRAAMPFLLDKLGTEDSRLAAFYREAYAKSPFTIRRHLPAPSFPDHSQMTAAELLMTMGPLAREFAPQLIAIFNRSYVRHFDLPSNSKIAWAEQLEKSPFNGWSGLPETLQMPALLRVLTTVGGDDPEIVPLILSTYSAQMPVWLPNDFSNMLGAIKLSEPLLLTNVSHPNPEVRTVVIGMLATLAPDHPEMAPVFAKATLDPSESVRHAAMLALGKTRPEFEPTLPILARMQDDTNVFNTGQARQLLLELGGGLKMFGRLNDALTNTNAEVRAAAARLLREYPKRAEIARATLIQHTNSAVEPDEAVQRAAAATLERMDRLESTTNQTLITN